MIDFENLPIVTSPKLYIDKHFKVPDPNGILSQRIFGPLTNYRCECGKYSTKILYNNLRCDVCGVLCTHSNIRYTTFAKIKLHFKIIKKQSIPIFQKWLKNKKFILDPLQRDLYTSIGIYLKYIPIDDEIEIQDHYNPNDSLILPLSITGIYTLYLGLYCIQTLYGSLKAKSLLNHFTDEILVTPPGTRPSLITDTVGTKKGIKTVLSSELDNAYCKLLNVNNHNKEHVVRSNIENYYKMICTSINLNTGIAISDDELKLFDEVTSFYQYSYNQIYETINQLLTGKTGLTN